jgi:hypothetical protein
MRSSVGWEGATAAVDRSLYPCGESKPLSLDELLWKAGNSA